MFKFYRQLERTDCGLACIRMVAKAHGMNVSLQYLQQIADLSRLGMSIGDLLHCLEAIGFECYSIRTKIENVPNMPLPSILYWNKSHYVVLYKVNKSATKFYIADPEEGKIKYSRKEFENFWIQSKVGYGVSIICDINEPIDNKYTEKPSDWKDFKNYILHYFSRYKKNLIIAFILSLAILLFDFSIPILLKDTVDAGIELKNKPMIVYLLMGQLLALVGGVIISNAMNYVLTKAGLRINLIMISDFLDKLSKFPLSFFDKKISADFVQKMSDQSRIKDFITSFPSQLLITLSTLLIFSAMMLYYYSRIFCVFILLSLMEIGWCVLFLKRKRALDYAFFYNSAINRNHAHELTSGMADLKVNNAENSRISKWNQTQVKLNKTSLAVTRLKILEGFGKSIISELKYLTVTGISAFAVVNGEISFGLMMTITYISGRLGQPFSKLT